MKQIPIVILNPKENAIVKVPFLPSSTPKDIRVAIGLPRPKNIYPFIIGKIASGAFHGDTSILVDVPETIAGIRIFEYSFEDFHKVRLQNGPHNIVWECPPPVCIKCPENGTTLRHIAVLHIYNEPLEEMPHPHAADHNLREFNQTLNYLGAKLELKIPGSVEADSQTNTSNQEKTKYEDCISSVEVYQRKTLPYDSGASPHDPPCGLILEEIAALDHRHDFIVSLMRILRKFYNYRDEIATLKIVLEDALKEALQDKSKQMDNKENVPIPRDLANLIVLLFGEVFQPKGAGGGAGGSQVCGGANADVTE